MADTPRDSVEKAWYEAHAGCSRNLDMPGFAGALFRYVAWVYKPGTIRLTRLISTWFRYPDLPAPGFFHDEVIGLDTDNKRLICRDRPDVSYDVLSINAGSAPDISAVPGAAANVTPVKPIDGFVDNWRSLCERILPRQGGVRIGIVGAGAGGVELALAVQYRLKQLLAGKWPDNAGL